MSRYDRWIEVAEGVFQIRFRPMEVNVSVVRGSAGLLVVDTRSSHVEADELQGHLKRLSRQSVVGVVNTHAHFDHCFGNARFGFASAQRVPIYAHSRVPAHLDEYERAMLAGWVAEGAGPAAGITEVVITPPTVLVESSAAVNLGDISVQLRHFGRGHTDNDLVVHVPHASAWLVGDLVEEAGPPMYGSGSYPLEWPATAAALLAQLEPDAVLVPGHGACVDATFAAAQLEELSVVADLVRQLHASGVPADEAVAAAAQRWPCPANNAQAAVRDGYRQLDG